MRISDWSSDVCSSDLRRRGRGQSKSSRLKPRLQQRLVPGKKNAGMSRRFPWYWSRSLLDQEILDLLALLGQRGHPERLLAAAGPGFLGIGRVAVFRRALAQLAALFSRLSRPCLRLQFGRASLLAIVFQYV